MTLLTTTQLAEAFGINKRTIQRWLCSTNPPNHCWQKRVRNTTRWSTVECVAVWLIKYPGRYINKYFTDAQKWRIHQITSRYGWAEAAEQASEGA